MSDYPGAQDMFITESFTFDSVDHKSIVIHETGGDMDLQSVYNTFMATERSVHFGVALDGTIAQFVSLDRGAGGNCCPDNTHNAYWNQFIPTYYPNMSGGLNRCTISIEHCNNSSNSLPVPQAQRDASFKLVLWLCQKYGLTEANIWGHNSINATNCPGTYPLADLRSFVAANLRSNQVNANQQKAALDRWNSHFVLLQDVLRKVLNNPNLTIPFPTKNSGIGHAWDSLYYNGIQLGPATSYEYDTNDWEGNPVKAHDFGSCRIEYYYSTGIWHAYGPGGQIQ